MRVVGNIASDSEVVATADGAITAGKPVVVNSNGTVAQVFENVDSATLAVSGSYTFESATGSGALYTSICFDSVNNKIAIAYQDIGNSNKITVAVGTVNTDGSITFGTPVLAYNASPAYFHIVYAGSGKIVIAYEDTSAGGGAAKVGTISGNSVSFGSQSSDFTGNGNTIQGVYAAYDSNEDRVVLAYKDETDGDDGVAVVGTVSGTSISFGSTEKFASSGVSATWDLHFDSSNNKIVIAYSDSGNSAYGTCKVGTVSDTSISFGSAAVFESADTRAIAICFDSTNNKMIIAYKDTGNSNYATAVVGTVSGTSISYGTPAVFNSANTYEDHSIDHDSNAGKHVIVWALQSGLTNKYAIGTVSGTSLSYTTSANLGDTSEMLDIVFDSNVNKFAVAYDNDGSSNVGVARTIQLAYNNTTNNLTSENFIGFAKNAVADGAVATLHTANSISRNQSSLTAGQTYFVQMDGTLSTSADSPSVTAGTAISATELIVKG